MTKHLGLISLILFLHLNSFAAAPELLVKAGTISISGHSAISTDLATIYGGIAGNSCLTTDGVSTCNSCIDTTGAVNACNQSSVYSNLKFSVSFKVTRLATPGKAKLFIESATTGVFDTVVSLASATYTADTSTVTLETTWAEICSRAGLTGSCAGASALLASKGIRYGVDSDATGEVEETERKTATIKLHYIPAGAAEVTQAFCAAGAAPTGAGVCNVTFLPGDAKAYIDSALYNGDDTTTTTTGGSVTWESIAIFPVLVTAGEAAVYTSFKNGAAQPILKTINPTDGSIPDSQVAGNLENYKKYCMVYGTRNKAQNIYKFVTTGVDILTSCLTPSEVAGLLDEKNCFISTAAFGSQSAPEVKIFRQFRNSFLLTNFVGKIFVKFYYQISPAIAEVISGNEYLKMTTRVLLYPAFAFAYLSLKLGFTVSVFVFLFILLAMVKLSQHMKVKKVALLIALLLIAPELKAEVQPAEEKISHPLAQEGLVRIKKDGTYIYDIERPLRRESSRLSFGQADHPKISILIQELDTAGVPTGVKNEFFFDDLYNETSGFILGYDYEWFYTVDKGKLGIQGGFSALFANGQGR